MSINYGVKPKLIPVAKLPPPEGTDPIYLKSLIDKAAVQFANADESAQVDYFEYIVKVKGWLSIALKK